MYSGPPANKLMCIPQSCGRNPRDHQRRNRYIMELNKRQCQYKSACRHCGNALQYRPQCYSRKSHGSSRIEQIWRLHWAHICNHSITRSRAVDPDPDGFFYAHRLILAWLLWFDWLSSNGKSVIGFEAIKQQSLGDR